MSSQLFGALATLGQEVAKTVQVVQEQQTARQRIVAWETAEIARIQDAGRTVRNYLDRAMNQRELVLTGLLRQMDDAIASKDREVLAAVLDSMAKVLQDNPLADLTDMDSVAGLLGDPEQVWSL